eukprot:7795643-Alexandrium_andersonii.AAC.1
MAPTVAPAVGPSTAGRRQADLHFFMAQEAPGRVAQVEAKALISRHWGRGGKVTYSQSGDATEVVAVLHRTGQH